MAALMVKQIPIECLKRGKYQTRRHFSPDEIRELAVSIKRSGLVQPIVVRQICDDQYEIVAGERRWRASQQAGLTEISCLVRNYNDEEAATVTAVENVNRVDLNPIEEAKAYQKLVDDFQYSHDEVAAVVGKSRAKISNSLRLLALELPIQNVLIAGDLSEGHGKILLSVTPAQRLSLMRECVHKKLSVRQLEARVRQLAASHASTDTITPVDVASLAVRLSEYLGCQATISQTAQQCRLTLDCHNLEILSGVLDKIGFQTDDEVF